MMVCFLGFSQSFGTAKLFSLNLKGYSTAYSKVSVIFGGQMRENERLQENPAVVENARMANN